MKLTNDNYISLLKLAAFSVAAIVIWRTLKPFSQSLIDGAGVIKDGIDSASGAAGVLLSDVTAAANGNFQPQFTSAAFPLIAKYVESDYTVDRWWRGVIEGAHEGNAELFSEILDVKGRLKPQYHNLIDKEVNAQSINQANEFGYGVGL